MAPGSSLVASHWGRVPSPWLRARRIASPRSAACSFATMADTLLRTVLGASELASDRLVAEALRDQVEDLPLTSGELWKRSRGCGRMLSGQEAQHAPGNRFAEQRLSGGCRDELRITSRRSAPFSTYPDAPARTAANTDSSSVCMVSTSTAADECRRDSPGGLDAAHARHVEVHEHDVWPQLAGDRRRPARRPPRPRRRGSPRRHQSARHQAVAEYRVVVHDQDASWQLTTAPGIGTGRAAMTVAPMPVGRARPSASRRARRPARAWTRGRSRRVWESRSPTPSSVTSTRSQPSVQPRADNAARRMRVAHHIGHRLGDDAVRRDLDRRAGDLQR